MMATEVLKEHQWLGQLVGEWTYETECQVGPDQPPLKSQGCETVRSLGGLWTIADGHSEMPGGETFQSIMTLGFDSARKRFVGTIIASMMTHLWTYDGALDAAGKVLTLDTEGPGCPDDGKVHKYQDIIEFLTDDYRTLTSRILGQDGQWQLFMKGHYHRKK